MRQAVDNDFVDVVYGDSDLLRLDFDDLMSQEWPAGDLPDRSVPRVHRYFSSVPGWDVGPARGVRTREPHHWRLSSLDVPGGERGPPHRPVP